MTVVSTITRAGTMDLEDVGNMMDEVIVEDDLDMEIDNEEETKKHYERNNKRTATIATSAAETVQNIRKRVPLMLQPKLSNKKLLQVDLLDDEETLDWLKEVVKTLVDKNPSLLESVVNRLWKTHQNNPYDVVHFFITNRLSERIIQDMRAFVNEVRTHNSL